MYWVLSKVPDSKKNDYYVRTYPLVKQMHNVNGHFILPYI